MSEPITYRCFQCKGTFVGLLSGYFLTGRHDGVFCSIKCIEEWVLEKAQVYEHGGEG